MFIPKSKKLYWTYHAHAKMSFYNLSEQRVRRVLHSPKRVEEGVAPKTIAVMQPSSIRWTTENKPDSKNNGKRQETWNQEIWVMVQDEKLHRKVISAWRYPGKTKPSSEIFKDKIREAYQEYLSST